MAAFDDLATTLRALEKRQLYRRRRVLESATGREIRVDGRTQLNFASNDYLGLAADERVRSALRAGVDRWGVGVGAAPLVSGHTAAHEALEEALADFTGRPRALLFGSGYAANVGTVNALMGRGDHLWQDRLNHASLLDGGWLSGAHCHWFAHGDLVDLERGLLACPDSGPRKLILTDGTFSMDGDLCPLPGLVAAAERHGAWLMVDDAHGCGVLGPGGSGVVDPALYSTAQVPVMVGTLGKAFGTSGAFVAGDEVLIETLIQRARNFIYSTGLPAALAVATLESLRIARAETWRREHLQALLSHFRQGAAERGVGLMPSQTPIQPILVGSSARALALSAALEANDILVPAIRPPTVPAGTARLRVSFSAAHRIGDVDRLLEALTP